MVSGAEVGVLTEMLLVAWVVVAVLIVAAAFYMILRPQSLARARVERLAEDGRGDDAFVVDGRIGRGPFLGARASIVMDVRDDALVLTAFTWNSETAIRLERGSDTEIVENSLGKYQVHSPSQHVHITVPSSECQRLERSLEAAGWIPETRG